MEELELLLAYLLLASKSRSCPERMKEMPYLGNLSQFFWLLAKALVQLYSLAPYAAGCSFLDLIHS